MVHFSLPLLLGLATSSTSGAASLPKSPPPTPMNLTELSSSSVTNTTSVGNGDVSGIDPRFGVQYAPGHMALRPISCLLNAVNAMSILAQQDFDGATLPVVASLPAYPDVVITSFSRTIMRPEPVPIRFLVWGIWSFALFALGHDSYRDILLTLGFNGATVGFLLVAPPDAPGLSLAGSKDDDSAKGVERRSAAARHARPPLEAPDIPTLISNSTVLSLTNTTTAFNADNLRIHVNAFGHSLTYRQYFLPVFAGLDYVARYPSSSPVASFTVHPADTDTIVKFDGVGTRQGTEAPIFEYQFIASALWETSRRMALAGVWSEAKIGLEVEGVVVGTGWIRLGGEI